MRWFTMCIKDNSRSYLMTNKLGILHEVIILMIWGVGIVWKERLICLVNWIVWFALSRRCWRRPSQNKLQKVYSYPRWPLSLFDWILSCPRLGNGRSHTGCIYSSILLRYHVSLYARNLLGHCRWTRVGHTTNVPSTCLS